MKHIAKNILGRNKILETNKSLLTPRDYRINCKRQALDTRRRVMSSYFTYNMEHFDLQPPSVGIIKVGNKSDSDVFMNKKIQLLKKYNFGYQKILLPETATPHQIINEINNLNNNDNINGILLELPQPDNLKPYLTKIVQEISCEKDVDCITHHNYHHLSSNRFDLAFTDSITNNFQLPCTTLAIAKIIKELKIQCSSKHVAIIGNSYLVGIPAKILMQYLNATTTSCHLYTEDLMSITKKADIVISATGIKELFNVDYLKPYAVVIDIGINIDEFGNVKGDFNPTGIAESGKHLLYTPVPGGVGPITLSMFLRNLLILWRKQNKDSLYRNAFIHQLMGKKCTIHQQK